MLLGVTNIHEYFREALHSALEKSSTPLTEEAQAYLVLLLSEFTRAERMYAGVDKGDTPALALLLLRAQDAEPEEAIRIYRHLGDSSLYLLGFFKDAKEQQRVGENYYISMGESAYFSVSCLVRDTTATTAALYAELADRFCELVTLLNMISLHGASTAPKDAISDQHLLDLVERFRKTGDQQILRILKEHGMAQKILIQ